MQKQVKIIPIKFNLGLNPDGSEIIDKTVLTVALGSQPSMSADQKLKQMLQRELAKDRDPNETNLDAYDFELPNDEIPLHPSVEINPSSARSIKEQYAKVRNEQKQQQKQKQKQTDDDHPVVRKSAQTDRAKRVANDQTRKQSARENASDESQADETENE